MLASTSGDTNVGYLPYAVLLIALLARVAIFIARKKKAAAKPGTPISANAGQKPAAQPATPAAPAPWPQSIPKLYPGLDPQTLCHFLGKAEYERILQMRHVVITPFYDKNSSAEEKYFGIGLKNLLIRDLRLHRDISVLGPEDSPDVPLSSLDVSYYKNATLVGGAVRFESSRIHGYFQIFDGEAGPLLEVSDEDFHRFLLECAQGLIGALGLQTNDLLLKQWQTGRPRTADDLREIGELTEMPNDPIDRQNGPKFTRTIEMYRRNPNFPLPLHLVYDEAAIDLEDYLQALARDPYDVQLQFMMHNKIWTGGKGELAAFQYLRRAIELCPGHGKAHMAAASAALVEADLYYHLDLGYHLLPNNGFAVNNYLVYVLRKKISLPDPSIAYEGVRLDPQNMSPYWLGIQVLELANHVPEALGLALRLKEVVTPPLSERTIYCIHQNPRLAAKWKAGNLDLQKEVDQEIAQLQAKLHPKS